MDALVEKVRERLYEANPAEKFGTRRRVILCLTENPLKLREVAASFRPYGIEVHQASSSNLEDAYVLALLSLGQDDLRVVSVLREETRLLKRGSAEPATLEDLEALDHESRLTAFKLVEGGLVKQQYERRTEGYLDSGREAPGEESCYDWDYRFVVKSVGKTYWELARVGAKISARDFVLADYAQDDLYYSQRIDMRFSPQALEQTVDFSVPVRSLLEQEPLFSSASAQESGLTAAFSRIESRGLFWRSAKNRMERNWWYVGLAGLPLTPKKDKIHELTFFVHDLFHHMRDDPIITGPVSAQERRVYIALRMLSEAITLGLADMVFIDTLVRSGVEYDFSARKIYPLYSALRIGNSEQELRELLWMNTRYCLRGDDSLYRERLGGVPSVLEDFKGKYMPFFVEDYRWTAHNIDNMSRADFDHSGWWEYVEPLAERAGLDLLTLRSEAQHLPQQGDELVRSAFDRFYEHSVRPTLFAGQTELVPLALSRSRAFARYMIAQSSIFFKEKYQVPETAFFRDTLGQFLLRQLPEISAEAIGHARAFYGEYVERLGQCHCIQSDQVRTFQQVHPLFEPFYVYYDEEEDFYEDLSQISGRLLGP